MLLVLANAAHLCAQRNTLRAAQRAACSRRAVLPLNLARRLAKDHSARSSKHRDLVQRERRDERARPVDSQTAVRQHPVPRRDPYVRAC